MPPSSTAVQAPAHPWKKTVRTILGGLLTAAVTVPLIVSEAGIDLESSDWAWLAGVLAVLAAFTRVMALPSVNKLLTRLGLGHDDVEASQVIALQVKAGATQQVVAGDASILPTGTPVPADKTVGELGQTLRS